MDPSHGQFNMRVIRVELLQSKFPNIPRSVFNFYFYTPAAGTTCHRTCNGTFYVKTIITKPTQILGTSGSGSKINSRPYIAISIVYIIGNGEFTGRLLSNRRKRSSVIPSAKTRLSRKNRYGLRGAINRILCRIRIIVVNFNNKVIQNFTRFNTRSFANMIRFDKVQKIRFRKLRGNNSVHVVRINPVAAQQIFSGRPGKIDIQRARHGLRSLRMCMN